MLVQKKSLVGSKRNEIMDVLLKLITTRKVAIEIIEAYEKCFGINVIDELKSLSNNYSTI